MIRMYEGIVNITDGFPQKLFIGETEILPDLEYKRYAGPVTVAIADQRFTGKIDIDAGSPGYSEYTPGDPSYWRVGAHDILEILEGYQGARIAMWVADEPVNLFDPPPSWVIFDGEKDA